MAWVKATDRLPVKCGERNSVIIRSKGFGEDQFGHEYPHSFVTTGYRNFSDLHPKFYFNIGCLSFLTNENIEWLDESVDESAIQLIKDIRHGNIYKDPVDAAANFLIEHGYEK